LFILAVAIKDELSIVRIIKIDRIFNFIILFPS
jgi:hypothetical protein